MTPITNRLRPAALLLGCTLALGACATGGGPSASLMTQHQAATSQELTRLGQAAFNADGHAEALAHFRSALMADPSNAAASLGIAEIFLAQGKIAEAEAAFSEILSVHPTRAAEAHQGLGIVLLRKGHLGGAEDHLRQAVTLNPGLWRAWNALGVAADGRSDWAAANEAYGRALAINAHEPDILNNAGVSALMQADTGTAIRHLSQALARNPKLTAARSNLRIALAAEGRYSEAMAGQDALTPEQLNNIGYVAMLRGDLTESHTYLTRAISASPSYYAPAERNLRAMAHDRQAGR